MSCILYYPWHYSVSRTVRNHNFTSASAIVQELSLLSFGVSNSLLQSGQLDGIHFSLRSNESVPRRTVIFVLVAEVVLATSDNVAIVPVALKDVRPKATVPDAATNIRGCDGSEIWRY